MESTSLKGYSEDLPDVADVDGDMEVAPGRFCLRPKQLKTFILLGFYSMPLCWLMVCPVFVAFEPDHQCAFPPSNLTRPLPNDPFLHNDSLIYDTGKCWLNESRFVLVNDSKIVTDKKSWDSCPFGVEFDDDGNETGAAGIRSIVTDWGLVCGNSYLAEISTMIFMCGQPLGNFLFTPLADRMGRKWVMLITGWAAAAVGFIICLANSFILFCFLRLVQSALAQGSAIVAFTLIVESLEPRQRNLGGVAYNFFWALGMLILALMAYLIRQWRYLYLAICLPTLVTVTYVWFIDESIPWLYAKQVRAIRANLGTSPRHRRGDDGVQSPTTREDVSLGNQMKQLLDCRVIKRLAVMGYMWFVNSLTYYGLSLSTPTLAGDVYFNFFLSGLVEVPATVLVLATVPFVGRRILLLCLHVLGGIALGCIPFLPASTPAGGAVALFMLGKFAISGSFTLIFLFSQEVFPTVVRSSAVGIVSAIGGVANILAPNAFTLSKVAGPGVTNAVFGVTSLVAGFLVLLMPETLNKALPNTLGDL